MLNTVAVGQQVVFVPKNSAILFTTYDLGGWIHGLSVGGDVTYQSRLFLRLHGPQRQLHRPRRPDRAEDRRGAGEASPSTPSSAYKVGPYRFAINGYNLADRLNYTQVFGNRARRPSPGRTIILSVGASF